MPIFTVLSDCNTIQLTQGRSTLVDAQDYPELSRYRWHAGQGGRYAKRFTRGHVLIYMHRLVLGTVVGPCPPGLECRHLNGDKFDNRRDNLRWGTPSENKHDSLRHGTANCLRPEHQKRAREIMRKFAASHVGEANPRAKLTESQVRMIRATAMPGRRDGTMMRLARELGVSRATVSAIARGKAWRSIEGLE